MKPATVKLLGKVAIIRLKRNTSVDVEALAAKIMESNRGIKTVLLIDKVDGIYRVPVVKHVAGSMDTETVVKEDGIFYRFDASKLMFSLGNSFERRRMKNTPKQGETVVDMFAGIGQFTIPVAKSPASHVYAFEINSEAYRYLIDNLRTNRVEEKVTAYNLDCRMSVQIGLANSADRVIMGYLRGTAEFLDVAYQLVKPEGGVIHFHEISDTHGGWRTLYETCLEKAKKVGCRIELLETRAVKSYSPKLSHWVLDLRVRRIPILEPSRDLGKETAS
ncbi:MAG: class I SAM-dependent methyltransferase family protein [Candidatus Caldarchaeum sp.]|nr:class I SAM-dependent methyltransferase family protein [Candidatus Caldarchaeum sp.]